MPSPRKPAPRKTEGESWSPRSDGGGRERLYRRLAGETEARNVQRRMNMTADERRATPPWATQDVPDEEQIVRHR